MKQRIAIRAIIQQEGKTLLLKRATGRKTILGLYELPGGKLEYAEQPEDALRRYLYDDAGLHIHTSQLFDAVTYIDKDDRDIQYVVLLYRVALRQGNKGIRLSANYNRYQWKKLSEIQQNDATDLTQLLLGIVQQKTVTDESRNKITKNDVKKASKFDATLYTDGGSRGNPGPSAAGFVLLEEGDQVVDEGGVYLGITTNNQAEYQGVRIGLERALERGIRRLDVRVDSMLVVNQLNGVYTIKNRELWPIHERIRGLIAEFEHVRFSHVRREFNMLADGMVNKTLDQRKQQAARDAVALK